MTAGRARRPVVDVHVAGWLIGAAATPVRQGAVAVTAGRVLSAGPAAKVLDGLRRTGARVREIEWAGVLTPGLVNAHSHLQYTCMAEVGRGRYGGFEDWSRSFQSAYEHPHDWAAATADGYRRALATGTTAVADVVTDHEALEVPERDRLHGIRYWELFAWQAPDWHAHGRDRLLELVARPGPPLGLSPHAPYSLDTDVIRELGPLAAELGVRLHMHLAESAWETAYVVDGTGALADGWRARGYDFHLLRAGGAQLRPVAYAEAIGALGPDCHVAHGIYVDADDRAILRRHRTAVALCPRSNETIGLDPAPVADYLREGNPICVGTDSLSSAPSLDPLADVAALYRLARAQGYAEPDLHARLLDAATRGGAAALGMSDGSRRIGELTRGAVADIAVFGVDGATGEDVLAALVESGEGTATATILDGEVRWTSSSNGAVSMGA